MSSILFKALLLTKGQGEDDQKNPLTLTANTAGSTVQLTQTGSPTVSGLQYRRNKSGSWSTYSTGTTITLENEGDYVQFQNTEETLSTSTSDYVYFVMTGSIAGSGNIQSMVNWIANTPAYCYSYMFQNCTSLTTAPELPATTLDVYCYYNMFAYCSGLTTVPELPVTTLTDSCYRGMFLRCTSLTTAPELPATTLAPYCYRYMFNGCSKLNYISVGFTSWHSTATGDWVSGVASSGTFVKPEELSTTRGNSYIPSKWIIKITGPEFIEINDQSISWNPDNRTIQLEGDNVETWYATNLPAGLTLNSSTGKITGTPTVNDGTYTFTVIGTNPNGYTAQATITITIDKLTAENQSISQNYEDEVNYSIEYSISSSSLNPTFTIVEGEFPEGLTLNTSTGVITGTSTEAFTGDIQIQISADGCESVTFTLSIFLYDSSEIIDPIISDGLTFFQPFVKSATVPQVGNTLTLYGEAPQITNINGTIGTKFNGNQYLYDENANYWTIPTSNTSPNMSFSLWVNFQEIPSESRQIFSVGSAYSLGQGYEVCVQIDTDGRFSIEYRGHYAVTLATLTSATLNQWFNVIVTLSSGTMKTYLNGSYKGGQYRTYKQVAHPFMGICCWNDSGTITNDSMNVAFSRIRIYNRVLTTNEISDLANESIEAPEKQIIPEIADQSFTWTDSTTSIQLVSTNVETWTVSNLPYGLTLNSSTGQITGTPEVDNGTYTFTVTGESSTGNTATATITLTVSITQPIIPEIDNQSFTWSVSTTSIQIVGTNVETWTATNLPEGLILNSSTGQITGMPTPVPETYTFTVTGESSTGNTVTATITLTVSQVPLTLTANSAGSTVSLTQTGSPTVSGLQYRTNSNNTWTAYTIAETITLENEGDYIQFQNTEETLSNSTSNYVQFEMAGSIAGSGNIQSMVNWIENAPTYCYYRMFSDCPSLTSTPELPATTLADCCYQYMFYNCSNLTAAPELPVTTLATSCYSYMFYGCTSLTEAPELPATTLAERCYMYMFRSCESLTSAPELPATTLANYCYQYMFQNCTSFTTAPELPATTLAENCYQNMFRDCKGLTSAPELPATTLATSCYNSMFHNCSNLTSAPELPATTLATSCYQYMFYGTSLTSAPTLPATTLTERCYMYMFSNCSNLTVAPELPATTLATSCYNSMFLNSKSLTTAPELPVTTLATQCYASMFSGCSNLTSAPELPATTLATSCYANMFKNCSNLTFAPELPATTLAENCYQYMFRDCTNLTSAPELPATTLAKQCYQYMFYNCTSLTTAPELPATTLAERCYYQMFYNCTSLTTAPSILPATTLANYCYQHMFQKCSNLTAAPELPATTLANYCYSGMFHSCTKLNYIKVGFTSWITKNTSSWVYGVETEGTFEKPEALPDQRGASNIPPNWTVENWDEEQIIPEIADQSFAWSFTTTSIQIVGTNVESWTASNLPTGLTLDTSTGQITGTPTVDNGTYTFTVTGESSTGNTVTATITLTVSSVPLTLTANTAGSTVKLTQTGDSTVTGLQYRTNSNNTWTSYTIDETITLENEGDFVQFQNTEETLSYGNLNYVNFEMTGSIAGSGNMQSMVNWIDKAPYYCYYGMFRGCTSLTSTPELPAMNALDNCYESMFAGCTSLTTAPKLPATILGYWCYQQMFRGCTSLTTAPELPATTLEPSCYESMFAGCTSLNYIKVAFTEWNEEATHSWVYKVASEGTFVKPEALADTRGTSYIPQNWTVQNY